MARALGLSTRWRPLRPARLRTLSGVHGDLHTRWQADRALTPEERRRGLANFSDAYLADRAAMLAWKLKLATEDFGITDGAYGSAPDAWFEDIASGLQIDPGPNWTHLAHSPGGVANDSRWSVAA